jgi:hypothetical protein
VASVPLDANFAQTIQSLPAGTVAQIGAGTLALNHSITIPSGVELVGAGTSNFDSHLIFNLSAADPFAFICPANASNIAIVGLDVHSSHGILKLQDGNRYSSIHLLANQLQYGANRGNTDCYAIDATIGVDDLEICWNYFHDSPNTDRNWETWGDRNSHLDHNLFFNVHDGGHLLEPTLNDTFSYNYGTHLYRMGQEIQGSGKNEAGLALTGNVFYDYLDAYNDTEGMSVCPNWTTGVICSGNYIRLNLAAGSSFGTMTGGAIGGPNRFGYAIESICPNGLFTNNTLILAATCADAIATGEHSTANNNTVWGGSNAIWGVFGGDGSPTGASSSWSLGTGTLANVVNASLAGAPSPPANNIAGPAIYFQTNGGLTWTPNFGSAVSTGTVSTGAGSVSTGGDGAVTKAAPTLLQSIQLYSDGTYKTSATQP